VVRSHWYEEFEVGTTHRVGERLITLADHLAFCQLVGYRVPLFLDDAAGRATQYGGLICPSHLIMSFSTSMTGALFSDSIRGLVALEGACFMLPVRPGDTIRTEVEIVSKRLASKPGLGVVTFRDHVYNQHDDEVFRNDKIALIAMSPRS
jgi:acyl dehydratase